MKLAAVAVLLLAGCGGGGGSDPAPVEAAPVPPVVASEVWTRQGPVLVPSQEWEFSEAAKRGSVYEPAILRDEAGYTMWYGGGWEKSAIGVATSTDGIHWTKRADNPIIGQGRIVEGMVARVNVMREGGETYVYFPSTIDGVGAVYVVHSPDGVTNLSKPAVFMLAGTGATSKPNNTWMVRREDGRFALFFDSIDDPNRDVWETYSAICETLLGPCTINPAPLRGMQVGKGAYGSGWAEMRDGKMHTYYLAGPVGGPASNLPSFVYHAETVSGETTVLNGGKPVLDLLPGFDQVGDPFVLDVGSERRMYVSDVFNPQGYSEIGMAVRR